LHHRHALDRGQAASFPDYRPGEHRADRFIHAAGLILGTAALAGLAAVAVRQGRALLVLSLVLYGGALAGMLTCSALYNLAPPSPRKERLRRLDHAAIFVMIAGTYTPFILIRMQSEWAIGLLLCVWTVAITGAFLKLLYPRRFERLSIAAYLLLGWSGLPLVEQVFAALPGPAIVLLAAGGILYTVGVLFHLCERLPYHNAVWHGVVLIAAGCHYVAILGYVVPS
jgi:hemolysin III